MLFLFRCKSLVCQLLFACVLLVPSYDPAAAEEIRGIQYSVELADAKNHYIRVQMRAVADGDKTELMMAVWTPGSYLVREFARHIDSMTVKDSDGNSLPFEKTRKNRWIVKTKAGQELVVSYRLYCNEVSVRTNFVKQQCGVLNGAPTFLTIPDRMDQPHHVTLKMPAAWKDSASSMNPGDDEHSFVAADFDELVDSPIVAGLVATYPFEAGGVTHHLVNVGESGYWDGDAAARDLKRTVEQHQKIWGVVPYDRYLFMNVIAESGGGLEHDFCNLALASRWAFRDPEKYQNWLSLTSHEFFHTWNVRRLRPKPLQKYDYENEIYTDSLWVAEGITSYYEDVALVRAGLIDRDEYLNRLSEKIEKVQSSYGRNVQSLRDASFDTWIKFYRPDENSSNTRVSYYQKGAIVAFLLDMKIRELTGNQKCLDDVMRAVYTKFQKTGYTQADFRGVASEVAGDDLGPWFKVAVDSTTELDYQLALDWLGLEFKDPDAEKDDPEAGEISRESTADEPAEEPAVDKGSADKLASKADEPDENAEEAGKDAEEPAEEKPELWLGLKLDKNHVSSVQPASPAFEAGFNPGDDLIGINGFGIHESLATHLKQFRSGDQIDVMISRRGKLLTLTTTVAVKPEANWKLAFLAEPSDKQMANVDVWLK